LLENAISLLNQNRAVEVSALQGAPTWTSALLLHHRLSFRPERLT
jgi:hypothetical protein